MNTQEQEKTEDRKKMLVKRLLSSHEEYMKALNELYEYDKNICAVTYVLQYMVTEGLMRPRVEAFSEAFDKEKERRQSAE